MSLNKRGGSNLSCDRRIIIINYHYWIVCLLIGWFVWELYCLASYAIITNNAGDNCEGSILFQRISILLNRFNSILLQDSLV